MTSDIRTVTVDMSGFSGPVNAQWFDPTNDTFRTITGSPFQNGGGQEFTPPGINSTGDMDWVLDLEVK